MVQSEDMDEPLFKMHSDLCVKLNLDPSVTKTSWETFESINKKFGLEGDKLHWLGCSIYVACYQKVTPTVDTSTVVRGSGVSLTSLLRHSNLSFVQFFNNITRWIDMAQLPDPFKQKIQRIRSTFSVTFHTFRKFVPCFTEIFISPEPGTLDVDASRHRNRKSKAIPLTVFKIFEYVWNLFIVLKTEEQSCSTDTIKCFHLLYCCIDLAFYNILTSDRRDLLNHSTLEDVLSDSANYDSSTEMPCIVKKFVGCDSVIKEALHMKMYTFRDLMHKLITENIIIANEEDLTHMFYEDNFDHNFRNVSKTYERLLLSQGEFDERIFLAEYKRQLMEKEQTFSNDREFPPGDSTFDNSIMDSPRNGVGTTIPRGLATPLTGRHYLGPREACSPISNDRSTAEKVARLHSLIGNNRTSRPSEALTRLFESCKNNPQQKIDNIVSNLKTKFIEACEANSFSHDNAVNYTEIGQTLFYKYVELVLFKEKNTHADVSMLVEKDIFYQCMFTCCLEMVLFCYNFPHKFPWILGVLGVEPIHFVKVIELIVRANEQFLFRELIKHLNRIEETVIDSLAWKVNSPIWDAITNSGQEIPKFADIALPGHLLYNDTENTPSVIQSPAPPSAIDYFQSPVNQVSRNLFPNGGQPQQVQKQPTHLVLSGANGHMQFIPIMEPQRSDIRPDPSAAALPRKTGSLTIIFRKFYNLAGIRMQHLCTHLGFTDFELKRKIWTIFEDSIRQTDLIKDRHLDQLLMCAIYVICRLATPSTVGNFQNLFSDIMKCYRQQPQACSSVYRDVLIEKIEDEDHVKEVRKDLIQFYNAVYVKAMQKSAIRFQPSNNHAQTNNLLLSPLPATRRNLVSPNLQTGRVIVKPMDISHSQIGSSFNYFFSRSPSKELQNINRAISNNGVQGKRLLDDMLDHSNQPNKRISNRKIQSLVEERRSQNMD